MTKMVHQVSALMQRQENRRMGGMGVRQVQVGHAKLRCRGGMVCGGVRTSGSFFHATPSALATSVTAEPAGRPFLVSSRKCFEKRKKPTCKGTVRQLLPVLILPPKLARLPERTRARLPTCPST